MPPLEKFPWARLAYIDPAADYRNAAVSRQRVDTASEREIVVGLAAAVAQEQAQLCADVLLEESWVRRTRHAFELPPSELALEPGDVVTLDGEALHLTGLNDGVARKVEAAQFERAVYEPPPAPPRAASAAVNPALATPHAVLMDLAMIASEQPATPWVAARAEPWPGPLALLRRTGATSFALNRTITAQATMGRTLTGLAAGLAHRLDHSNTLDVQLEFGALSSLTREELLNGGNIAALGTAATGFEIIQFESATLIAPDTYRLEGLLRGQAGSAAEMLALRAAGEEFVLLNEAVVPAIVSLSEATLPSIWRIGPARLDHGHPAYVEITMAATLRALRPLAPVQPRMKRELGGIALSWIRQTRISGDSWDLADVPLGEDSEAYRLDILDGATLKRSVNLSTPSYFYSDAAMTSDFGAPQATLRIRVAQLSASIGPGTPLERLLHV